MKPLETIFFILVVKFGGRLRVNDIINILCTAGVPHKQLLYFIKKWCNKGFYNYGVSVDNGWLELHKLNGAYKDLYKLAHMTIDNYPFVLMRRHVGRKEAKELSNAFAEAISNKCEPVNFLDRLKGHMNL